MRYETGLYCCFQGLFPQSKTSLFTLKNSNIGLFHNAKLVIISLYQLVAVARPQIPSQPQVPSQIPRLRPPREACRHKAVRVHRVVVRCRMHKKVTRPNQKNEVRASSTYVRLKGCREKIGQYIRVPFRLSGSTPCSKTSSTKHPNLRGPNL